MPISGYNGVIKVGTVSIPAQIEVDITPVCEHPELVHDTHVFTLEWEYSCSACHKKIIIPLSTMLDTNREKLPGIIGLAFGEKWKRQLEGQV